MHKPASAAAESKVSAAGRPLAVDVRDVSLTFETADGKVEALSRINLRIAKGEFVSLIGPSGCGKTTLLRLIADLEQPTLGTLLVNGVSTEQARLQRAYGYIFQAPALYPWRTIEKNVMLPLEVMGFSALERRERAKRYLALVNLSGFERKFPWQLSGGMQQRASIARALSFDPALLLMDEPFGALDEIVRDHLNEQLLRLWDKTGKTVIFVTHSIPEAVAQTAFEKGTRMSMKSVLWLTLAACLEGVSTGAASLDMSTVTCEQFMQTTDSRTLWIK
jgi:NitT/TauT family transport system ATP-binding protein